MLSIVENIGVISMVLTGAGDAKRKRIVDSLLQEHQNHN